MSVLLTALPQAAGGQQLPNLSPDQIQRMQQQLGQGQNASSGGGNDLAVGQGVTMQPAVPRNEPALRPSRLEQILSSRAGTMLRQFGYDQLGRARAVTVPQTGAVQDDYVLGPGDEVVVSLRGQENGEFRASVDRNGQIVFPRLPAVSASGRSFGSFRADLEAAVHRSYVATDASVSVGRVRQISVLVSGQVNNPGQRLLTGLSSAVDALLVSGGVAKTGSLRNIRIVRGGRQYSVDLYSVLTDRGTGAEFRLADGDRILVPPLGKTVAVAGLVRQPGIYELAPRTSTIPVRTLMALAGGAEVRGRYRLSILRVLPDGSSGMSQVTGEVGSVGESEILFAQLGADETANQATLAGGSGLAGSYAVQNGTKLSELLKAPGALGPSPYTPFGLVIRKDATTLMSTLLPITPVAVLSGREDLPLQSNDIIKILSTNEARLLTFAVETYLEALSDQQAVIRNPLSATAAGENNVVKDIASRQGNSEFVDVGSVPATAQREQVNALLNRAVPGSPLAQQQADELRAGQRAQQQADVTRQLNGNGRYIELTPNGQIRSRNQDQNQNQGQNQNPGSNSEQNQNQGFNQNFSQNSNPNQGQNAVDDGEIKRLQPGGDINSNFGAPRNFTDQSVEATRFATNREVQTFGQLSRQLNIDPLILMNFLVEQRVKLDGAVRGPGNYFIGPSASLKDVVQAAGGTINWADESGVELITTAIDRQAGRSKTVRTTIPLRESSLSQYILRPRDQLRFSQTFSDVGVGSVTIQGEVRFSGSFPILRGEHLSDVLARAGGLTNVSYPYGTVFLRQSAAQVERDSYRRAADEVQNQLIVAMTRVGNDKIEPNTFASMQSFVTELRNQRAVGRISITADPSVLAANPGQDPLMEAGDVIYIPPRPSTIAVLGQVLQPGNFPYRSGETIGSYIDRAGGYSSTADEGQTFIVLPDGTARRVERSWLSFKTDSLPPGSTIFVPRDITPLDLRQTIIDVSQIFSQFAISIASVAVLAKQ